MSVRDYDAETEEKLKLIKIEILEKIIEILHKM